LKGRFDGVVVDIAFEYEPIFPIGDGPQPCSFGIHLGDYLETVSLVDGED